MNDHRYRSGRLYDLLSFERSVYRAGRIAGINQLALKPGDTVLDIGCGTGLNFAYLVACVGPLGRVIGVDLNESMVQRAQDRVGRHGWKNVEVIKADASTLTATSASLPDVGVDGVLFTYVLSVIPDWTAAWNRGWLLTKAGCRVAVVDMAEPEGRWSILSPLARAACYLGGADIERHPWELVLAQTTDTHHEVTRGGHLHAVSGRKDDEIAGRLHDAG